MSSPTSGASFTESLMISMGALIRGRENRSPKNNATQRSYRVNHHQQMMPTGKRIDGLRVHLNDGGWHASWLESIESTEDMKKSAEEFDADEETAESVALKAARVALQNQFIRVYSNAAEQGAEKTLQELYKKRIQQLNLSSPSDDTSAITTVEKNDLVRARKVAESIFKQTIISGYESLLSSAEAEVQKWAAKNGETIPQNRLKSILKKTSIKAMVELEIRKATDKAVQSAVLKIFSQLDTNTSHLSWQVFRQGENFVTLQDAQRKYDDILRKQLETKRESDDIQRKQLEEARGQIDSQRKKEDIKRKHIDEQRKIEDDRRARLEKQRKEEDEAWKKETHRRQIEDQQRKLIDEERKKIDEQRKIEDEQYRQITATRLEENENRKKIEEQRRLEDAERNQLISYRQKIIETQDQILTTKKRQAEEKQRVEMEADRKNILAFAVMSARDNADKAALRSANHMISQINPEAATVAAKDVLMKYWSITTFSEHNQNLQDSEDSAVYLAAEEIYKKAFTETFKQHIQEAARQACEQAIAKISQESIAATLKQSISSIATQAASTGLEKALKEKIKEILKAAYRQAYGEIKKSNEELASQKLAAEEKANKENILKIEKFLLKIYQCAENNAQSKAYALLKEIYEADIALVGLEDTRKTLQESFAEASYKLVEDAARKSAEELLSSNHDGIDQGELKESIESAIHEAVAHGIDDALNTLCAEIIKTDSPNRWDIVSDIESVNSPEPVQQTS